jgi:hypothetical protein
VNPGVSSGMTIQKRILDMLPVILVFFAVTSFATYVTVAYIVHDAFWLQTLATYAPVGPPAPVSHSIGDPATTPAG